MENKFTLKNNFTMIIDTPVTTKVETTIVVNATMADITHAMAVCILF